MFTKGQKVIVNPPMTPNLYFEGEVLRKTKYGYSVKYAVNGMMFKETFTIKNIHEIEDPMDDVNYVGNKMHY